jgi:hypothetical protein
MSGLSSIIGVHAVRIARLDADGSPDYGNPVGAFVLCGGISTFQHDYEKDTGTDLYVKDAAGNACIVRKKQDKVKRATFTLTLCRSDYRIDEILGLADAVMDGSDVVGRTMNAAEGCGAGSGFNGVSIELWSEQWDCDVPLDGAPYMRTILPRCYLSPSGFTRQDGESLPVYEGYSQANANFDDGPMGDLDLLSGTSGWVLADIDDTVLPTCPSPIGYVNIPGSAS